MTTFSDLKLAAPLLQALTDQGYEIPTPIQAGSIPHLLEGRDLLGLAQTGTGKTASFALPILQHLHNNPKAATPKQPRVLVLAPTRELVAQISDSFKAYARYMKFSQAVVFGGVGQGRQVEAMRRGVDVLVAAPGRLLDLIGQGYIDLSGLEVLGAGRSRPYAGYGLCARYSPDHELCSRPAADPAVLGHHAKEH
jgi:ATP-dependent RNA helicase RhlE